jgi:hypothetical protein
MARAAARLDDPARHGREYHQPQLEIRLRQAAAQPRHPPGREIHLAEAA